MFYHRYAFLLSTFYHRCAKFSRLLYYKYAKFALNQALLLVSNSFLAIYSAIFLRAKHQGSRAPSKALALMMGEVLLSLQITKLRKFIPKASLVKNNFLTKGLR